MRSWIVGCILVSACSFNPNTQAGANSDAADLVDADPNAPDADPSAPDAGPCDVWSKTPTLFDPCDDISVQTEELVLGIPGRYLYHTDNHTLETPTGDVTTPVFADIGSATAIVVGRFQIDAPSSVRVIGSRPLLVIAWDDILLNGGINVSSQANFNTPDDAATDVKGAGANPAACSSVAVAAQVGVTHEEGGSGGGGGGFGSAGGIGGVGNVDNQASSGGAGGAPVTPPPSLRGGCPGAAGGQGNGPSPGQGAPGGGAVYLIARTSLTVNARIHAGGQGGHRAEGGRSAGGGGGSGGLIGLEAPSITLEMNAVLAANGGGGGGGGNNSNTDSKSGASGLASDSTGAAGGAGESGGPADPAGFGGDGGFVGDDTEFTKRGFVGGRGGGGGGGGVGFIVVSASVAPSIDAQAQISPAAVDAIAAP
jgi:hypothetical protein